jgi:aspartate racemase
MRIKHHAPRYRTYHGFARNVFIHIADPTGEAVRNAGICSVGLLGTMSVMNSTDFCDRDRERFKANIIVPNEIDKAIVDRIIFDELVRGELRHESKLEYLRIVGDLKARGAEGVILGCRNLPPYLAERFTRVSSI